AMVCFDVKGKEEAGLLLLHRPEGCPTPNGRWRVGVDFGTTNTTVYVNDGSGPRPLPFQARLRRVTRAKDQDRLLATAIEFLPADEQAPPFRTKYRPVGQGYLASDSRAVLDGHIYFLSPTAYEAY